MGVCKITSTIVPLVCTNKVTNWDMGHSIEIDSASARGKDFSFEYEFNILSALRSRTLCPSLGCCCLAADLVACPWYRGLLSVELAGGGF